MRSEDAVVADGGLALEAEQLGDRGAVEIGIEDAGPQPFGGKAERQVDGDGGFADAALAGADGNDMADAGDGLARRRAGTALRLGLAGGGLGAVGGQRHHDLAALGDLLGGRLGSDARRAEGGLHARSNGNGEGHGAGGDDDLAQTAIAGKVAAAGDFDGGERVTDGGGDEFIGHGLMVSLTTRV